MTFLARLIINGIAIWLASAWVTGITIANHDNGTWGTVLVIAVIALIFTVVNAFIKPVVQLLSLPLLILTLGLFTLVINALMLMLTAWISSGTSLRLDGRRLLDGSLGRADHLDRELPAQRVRPGQPLSPSTFRRD